MPSIHSSFPAGTLITNGLGASACNNLITANKFHLIGCLEVIIPPTVHSSGGSYPMPHGTIQNFYKPVQNQGITQNNTLPPFYIPTNIDPLKQNQKLVVVKLTINGKSNEKEFLLSDKPYNSLVKILDIIENSKHKYKVMVSNIKTSVSKYKLKIKNLRKR